MAADGKPDPVLEAAVPILSVDDLAAALAFYRDKLGFEVAWTWGEPAYLAGLCRDRIELHVGARGQAGPAGPSHVYFRMSGVDAYHRRLEAAGVEIVVPIADRPYGMRDFGARDPSGNKLDFGEATTLGPQRGRRVEPPPLVRRHRPAAQARA